MTDVTDLSQELATFARERAALAGNEGRFVVIAGTRVLGVFDTYNDALSEGYRSQALKPFLVKQINTVDAVANFSRHLKIA